MFKAICALDAVKGMKLNMINDDLGIEKGALGVRYLIQYILNGRNNYKPIIIQWIVWLEGFIIIYYKYHRKTGLLSKRK